MTVFYLSFVDASKPEGQRWLGGCFVVAGDMGAAVREAHRLGCNPGGEVLGGPGPDEVWVRDGFMNRLLTTREEIERAVGDAPGTARRVSAADVPGAESVCPGCNVGDKR